MKIWNILGVVAALLVPIGGTVAWVISVEARMAAYKTTKELSEPSATGSCRSAACSTRTGCTG